MCSETLSKRVYWVDVAKLLAVVAVIMDHTYGILYSNERVAYASYYSVSLFILMMGVTSYWSYSKNDKGVSEKVKKKCWEIIAPYLVATFIYSVFADKYFDFAIYVKRVICFNANGPFYYVLLYLQLLLIVPIIFYFLKNTGNKKYSIGIEIWGLAIVLVIAGLTTNYTNILSVTGGGGKLFGGTYLCLLYIGMMFGKYCDRISLQKVSVIVLFAVSLIVTMLWWNFISVDKLRIDVRVPFGAGFNPPSISLGIYAILVACTIYLFEKLLINSDKLLMLFAKISILGKHTLYVFLYHRLFLDYIFPQIPMITAIENIWFKRIIYFVGMVGGSMIIEFILERVRKLARNAYA